MDESHFPQVLLSKEQIKARKTSAVHVKPVYEIRFHAGGDGPFATQTMQDHNAQAIVKVLEKGGATKIEVYEVRERSACYEYKPVSLEQLADPWNIGRRRKSFR